MTDNISELAGRSIFLKQFNDTLRSIGTDAMNSTGVGFFIMDARSRCSQSFSRVDAISSNILKWALLNKYPSYNMPNSFSTVTIAGTDRGCWFWFKIFLLLCLFINFLRARKLWIKGQYVYILKFFIKISYHLKHFTLEVLSYLGCSKFIKNLRYLFKWIYISLCLLSRPSDGFRI